MYSESKRIEYLDSVRGLAALFVLLSHTIGAFDWPAALSAPGRWPFTSILFAGKEAVGMFFVLSGYVLSKPFVAAAGITPRKIFLPTFYLRRFTRIWLPWFFVFAASIFAQKFLFFHPATCPPISNWLDRFWHVPLTVENFFKQCAFLQHDATRQLLNQDWSLGVELKGSLLIPLFLFLSRGKRVFVLLALAAVFPIILATGHYYVSFIVGVLLARYGEPMTGRLLRASPLHKILVLLLGLSLYQGYDCLVSVLQESRLALQCGWIITTLGCALVLLAVFASSTIQRILNHRVIVFLGRISYSVYLVQFIVILCLLPPLIKLANQLGVVQTPVLFGLSFIASVGATIGCSALSYRLVEVPSINLGHRLTKGIQRRYQK